MIEINKTIAQQAMEALHQRNLDAVRVAVAPGARFYGWAPVPLDVDGYQGFMSALLRSPTHVFWSMMLSRKEIRLPSDIVCKGLIKPNSRGSLPRASKLRSVVLSSSGSKMG
jgi:hypothetical protein